MYPPRLRPGRLLSPGEQRQCGLRQTSARPRASVHLGFSGRCLPSQGAAERLYPLPTSFLRRSNATLAEAPIFFSERWGDDARPAAHPHRRRRARPAARSRLYLEEEGYLTLHRRRTGWRRWRSCARRLPDLVVLDVLMPKMDGFETLRAAARDLHRAGDHAHGAQREERQGARACSMGADDYVTKPFSQRELLEPHRGRAAPRRDAAPPAQDERRGRRLLAGRLQPQRGHRPAASGCSCRLPSTGCSTTWSPAPGAC